MGKWDLLIWLRVTHTKRCWVIPAGSARTPYSGGPWKQFQMDNFCSYRLNTKAAVNYILLTVVFVGEKSSESHSTTMLEGSCLA